MTEKKDMKFYLNVVAISLIFFLCGSGGFVNSTLQAAIEAWPEVSVAMIRMASTLPSVISLPVMLAVSKYIDKIGYRKSMIIGTILMTLGGIAPYFYSPNWTMVLIYRSICGVGMGFFGLRNALLLKSFEEKDHAHYVGISNAMNSLASVILTPVAGILCNYSWKHPYLLFAIGFIVFLFVVIGVKEPAKDETPSETKTVAKDKLDMRIWVYFVIIFVQSVVLYPVLSGMSTFVILKGIGSAAVAGTLIAFHNVGGFFGGFFINFAERYFKKASISVGFLVIMIGQILDLYVPNVIAIAIGTALTGVGYFLIYSMITVYTGRISTKNNLAMGSSVCLISMQLGIFLSVYYMSGVHALLQMENDVVSSWFATIIICAVTAVVTFLFRNKWFADAKK